MTQATLDSKTAVWPGIEKRAAIVLGLTAAAIPAVAVLPPGSAADALFVATSALAAGMGVMAVRTRRSVVRGGWRAVAAALVLLTLGSAITFIAQVPVAAQLRPFADLLFLAAYMPLFAAAYRFGRGSRRSDRTVILDTAIVGLTALPLVWELLVQPNLSEVTGVQPLMAVAIPVVDTILVSLAAPVLLFRYSRSTSARLFVAGLLAMGVGDSIFAVGTLDGVMKAGEITNLLWLTSYMLFAAAAWVPSAEELGAVRDPQPGSGDTIRIVTIAVGLLVAPLVTIQEAVKVGAAELTLFAAVSLVVAALVVLRLQRTIAQLGATDLRFRRFMNHDGFLAVIKDNAGRYVYMNSAAQRVRRSEDVDWYGRTTEDLYPPEEAVTCAEADALVRTTQSSVAATLELGGRTWHTERFAVPGKGGEVAVLGVDITDRDRAEREVRFQARLLESVRDAVVVVDTAGRFTYWNHGAEEMFEHSAAEMLGRDFMADLATGSEAQVEDLWVAVREGETDPGEWQSTRRDGSALWLNARVSPITDEHGTVSGYLAIIKDVTARRQSELELRRLGLAIDRANDAVIVTDADDRVTYVNPAFERMTGFSAEQVVGARPYDHPAGRPFGRALERARQSMAGWRGDLVDQRSDGSDLIAETSISPISADGAATSGFVTIKRDVTQERSAERAADRRARERALIAETLAALHASETPEETAAQVCRQLTKLPELAACAVITFDVDGCATVLAQALRLEPGLPEVRLSPERSAYLHSRAAAGPWVERWQVDESHPYYAMYMDLGVMANAYAPLLVGDRPFGLLIGASDQIDAIERLAERLPALVEFAAITSTLLGGPVTSRLATAQLRDDLRRVIAEEQFTIHFQPIVDLATGATRGYEALTRFDDRVPPDVRFQLASDLGLGLELEMACLKEALSAADQLPADAWVNVNVSPELVLGGLVGPLLEGSRAVVFEITEHQAITDYALFRQAVEPLRDRVRIAVDDAGAGFASLRHIIELSPSLVKLDRSLVVGIGEDNARQAVISGMVQFARSAGLSLVAEGIETEAELTTLHRLGVDLGQGYLLCPPRPVTEFRRARGRQAGQGIGAEAHRRRGHLSPQPTLV